MKSPEEIKQRSIELNKCVEKHMQALNKLRKEKEIIEAGLEELEQVLKEQFIFPNISR